MFTRYWRSRKSKGTKILQDSKYNKLLLPPGLRNTEKRLGLLKFSSLEEGVLLSWCWYLWGSKCHCQGEESDADRNSEQMGKSLLPPSSSQTLSWDPLLAESNRANLAKQRSSWLTLSPCIRGKNTAGQVGFGAEREKLYNQETHLGKFFSMQLTMEI